MRHGKRRAAALICSVTAGGLLLGCPAEEPPDEGPPEVTAGFTFLGPPGDVGWTYSHNKARVAAAQLENVHTVFIENVPERPVSETVSAIQELIEEDGADIVFTTSFGYMDATAEAAAQYPDVKFEHCSGFLSADNMSNYFGRMYQARYLSGMVAGAMTETNRIGITAAHPIAEVIRHINAITLGARRVNPDVVVDIEWVHAWYAPNGSAAAADALIDRGADVVIQGTDSADQSLTAKARGAYAIGYHSDSNSFAPETILTSAVWNWEGYYTERIQAVQDGTWESQSRWSGIETGMVGLGAYSPAVPQAVRDDVAAVRQQLADGDFDVFDGPILTKDGQPWVADGDTLSDDELLTMEQLVEGVVGDLDLENCTICG